MQYIIRIKVISILSILIFVSCTDILNDNEQYNSVHLKGGGWIQFNALDIENYLDNNFSLQLWISGDSDESNNTKTILSILNENDNNEIIFGLFRNTTINNGIDVYLNETLIETIINDNLDWPTSTFNLITITCEDVLDVEEDIIKIFINDTEVFSYNQINLQINGNDLIIGGKVNTSKTIASNFWTGYIDEMRLWSKTLIIDEIIFHVNNPNKLISSNTGNYSDNILCDLVGLWRFNYNNPSYIINDESCLELNLSSGVSNNMPECEDFNDCHNINGIIYTLPGYNVEYSNMSL